jgi:hypothetical protein
MPVDVARKLMTAEYAVLRLPLTVIANRVVGRYLEEDSRLRLGFEKTLGTIDTTVGRLVGDAALTRRGATLSHRSDMLQTAVVLEEKAEARKQAAEETLEQGKVKAEARRRAAASRARAEVETIREEQAAEKQAAAQKAEAVAQARAREVEREVEARLQVVEGRAEQQAERIAQRTKARTAKPKAQLKDATELASAAAKERSAAERLSDLADEEKARRKAGTAD